MGCFLACFGSSKDRRRRKQSNRRVQVQPRGVQRNASFKPLHIQQPASIEQDSAETETIVSSLPELLFKDKPKEQLSLSPSLSPRKKVTFDSNVKTYEHVELEEAADCASETNNGDGHEEVDSGKPSVVKSTQTQSSSEDSSVTSLGSYPPSHRYQNCRESDDECEDMEFGESDLDDDVDDESDGFSDDDDQVTIDEEEGKPIGPNLSARDRSLYVHSVLNPVENLSQWKAAKAKGGKLAPARPQKENFITTSDQEPGFNELSLSFKSKPDQNKRSSSSSVSDMAVDASLSNWLVSSQAIPPSNRPNSTFGFDASTPEKITSPRGSNPRSQDLDRPILGALTVEEIRQFSVASSPRKSPSRSPDDMPIIGTVGTYWTQNAPAKALGSASSYKGIPNTTSKYREDKKVNWHSTPFETRLERALERNGVAN